MQGIEDVFPQAYGGGMRLYPVSGTVTLPVLSASAATTNVQVSYTGQTKLRLNAQLLIANTIPNTTAPATSGVAIGGGKYELTVYVNPIWSVPALTVPVTDSGFNNSVGRAAVNGDRAVLVTNNFDGTAQYVHRLMRRENNVWV